MKYILLLLSIVFISCQSTKVYESYRDIIYNDNGIIFDKIKKQNEEPQIITNEQIFDDSNLTRYIEKEKITVINTFDFKLTAYSFFLKPLIITTAFVGETTKCVLWAGASFARVFWFKASGEAARTDRSVLGYRYGEKIMPQKRVQSIIDKREKARSELVEYPDFEKYRKTFCKSHIIIENYSIKISNYKTDNETEKIISYEKREYINGILVSKNIKKDFYTTIYYADFASYFVALPISIISGFTGYVLASIF